MAYTLGLDLGTNSIGWALVDHNSEGVPCGIKACGVRIFQEAVDAKTRTPKNRARRAARMARRLVARRKRRRENLLRLLVNNALLPPDLPSAAGLESRYNALGDPYELRRKGLTQQLSLHEFGRVLVHLVHRRGFQSNRKARPKEEGDIKQAISQLQQEIQKFGCRTLGEFLAGQKDKKRARYTSREMYQQEFNALWDAQRTFYPDVLTKELKVAAHNIIFHQRPLKFKSLSAGKCTFERNKFRAWRAWPAAQRFRLLQDLNHLQIKSPTTRNYRALTEEERKRLLRLLETQKTVSWDGARKALKLHEGELFNLEEGKRDKLLGDQTAYALRMILGEQWDELSDENRQALACDLLTIESEAGLLSRLHAHWRFGEETSEQLAKVEFEPGYLRLSLKAIRKILPYLERGLTYDKACTEAGYGHAANSAGIAAPKLGNPPQIRNPIVLKALWETRKVINAILVRYGRPGVIRVEMARDMKLTKRQKEALEKQNKQNEKLNRQAEDELRTRGIQQPSREDKLKYRLWKEAGEVCPYTGATISLAMLFSTEVDIEHILPYSRTLDDSYMNKTLCLAHENRDVKQKRSPFEAYSADPAKYESILQRVRSMPWPKRRRFEQKEIDTEGFISRQLNDTRYICREVKDYLATLGVAVEVSKGETTAWLRHVWNLNQILAESGSSEKNRNDHRHHAVDAVVIALTSRRLFQHLSSLSAKTNGPLILRRLPVDTPWPQFRQDAEQRIRAIVVSHAATHKLRDAFHEDTAYGYSKHNQCFVYRVPLDGTITDGQIERIRDKRVQELVKTRLKEFGGDKKLAFGNPASPVRHGENGPPIRSVRIEAPVSRQSVFPIRDRAGSDYKFLKFGNNHHVEIIKQQGTGKRKGIFVTTMEAARRARIAKLPIVQRTPPWQDQNTTFGEDWSFVMSLCPNDFVAIEENGASKVMRVQKLNATNGNIVFRVHTDARTEQDTEYRKSASALTCTKLQIDPLGNIQSAYD
jgi:CRISPR-associated endonuclease Csn1